MMYFLRQVHPRSSSPVCIPLNEADNFVAENSDLSQRFPYISKSHFLIQKSEGGKFFIKDLNSEFGTYVNGIKIGSTDVPLNIGDTIGFGVNEKSPGDGLICTFESEQSDVMNNVRNSRAIFDRTEPKNIELFDDEFSEIDSPKSINTVCVKTPDAVLENSSELETKDDVLLRDKKRRRGMLYSLDDYCGENSGDICFKSKELNYNRGEYDSATSSSEKNIEPNKNILSSKKSKFDVSKNSKSPRTMLIDPKPMTYPPYKLNRKDNGDVKCQKSHFHSIKKRERPEKQEYVYNKPNLDLSSTISKFSNKDKEPSIPLNNLQVMKQKVVADRKSQENRHSNNKTGNIEKKDSDNFMQKEKNSRKCSQLEPEAKNLISTEENNTIRKFKISGKNNNEYSLPSYEKNRVQQVIVEKKTEVSNLKQEKVVEKFLAAENIHQTNPDQSKEEAFNLMQNKSVKKVLADENIHQINPVENKAESFNLQKNKVVKKIFTSENIHQVNAVETEQPQQNRFHTFHNLKNEKVKRYTSLSSDYVVHEMPLLKVDIQLDMSLFKMVKSLLNLNPVWLEEQHKINFPPKQVTQGVASLPYSFTSYDNYASSFYPLLQLDIWQFMYEAYKDTLFNEKICMEFPFRILSLAHKDGCIEVKCESVINKNYHFEPREGFMTILEINNKEKNILTFGFIFKHKITDVNSDILHPCWQKNSEYLKDAKHWIFEVWIKERDLLLESSDILMTGKCVCYIRSRLKLVDALQDFKNSLLMESIIKPNLSTFMLSCSNFSKKKNDNLYTSRQMEIIETVCSEIYKPYLDCKICLISGPPGSGKTDIIIGILKTLFYTNNCNFKVLVTAPSNVAIDEIGCRLIELNNQYFSSEVKFVRIGPKQQVHLKMLPYFIDQKAMELCKKANSSSLQKQKEFHNLRKKISNLEKEPDSLNKTKKLKSLKEQYEYLEDSLFLKNENVALIKYKYDILKESHIVFTTLSSSSLSILRKTFKQEFISDINFSCCIVDEATQCTELEVLQPLALNISKLVLVGDDKQLPAAHSEYSKKYGFDRSMFERFDLYFKSTNQPTPVLSLTEQFRMHPSIWEFPSRYIYDYKLNTHSETISRLQNFPLQPYFILDFTLSSDSFSRRQNFFKCKILINNVCNFLAGKVDSSSSVGVIVPHESLRNIGSKRWTSCELCKNIEVNTVAGFQGKEKDIIIFFAFNPHSNPAVESFMSCERKFNVALTRAKKCLIICLDSTVMMDFPHWSKLLHDAERRNIYYFVSSPENVCETLENKCEIN